ncbi:hypothetical protein [Rhizobium leguminosarum]
MTDRPRGGAGLGGFIRGTERYRTGKHRMSQGLVDSGLFELLLGNQRQLLPALILLFADA